jgi:hypothetical protein
MQPTDFTSSPTAPFHPDLMWIIERPYQKGVLTQKQISDFVRAMQTGLLLGQVPEQ